MIHYCWIWKSDNTLQVRVGNPSLVQYTSGESVQQQQQHPPHPFIHILFPDATIYFINEAIFDSFETDKSLTLYNVSYLKSNLQKSVRRKQTDAAMSTASQLFHQNPNELLRRLPIIATEDVYWTNWINYIIWIMCWYSKTKTLSKLHYVVVMNTVKQLCELDVAFDYREMDKFNPLLNPEVLLTDPFFLAVTIRQNYGGMKGDMHLLAYTKEKKAWIECDNILSTNMIIHIPIFSKQHMLLESIDFHCSSIMDAFSGEIPRNVLRKWIWEFRSGRNVRKPWTLMDHLPQWEEINKKLDQLSREYWNKSEIIPVIRERSPKRQRLITDFIKK
jgi:hypothetical protein